MELFHAHRTPHHRSNFVAPNGDEIELETTAITALAPAPLLSPVLTEVAEMDAEIDNLDRHDLPDGGTYQDATPILAKLTREREEEQARLTRTVTINTLIEHSRELQRIDAEYRDEPRVDYQQALLDLLISLTNETFAHAHFEVTR